MTLCNLRHNTELQTERFVVRMIFGENKLKNFRQQPHFSCKEIPTNLVCNKRVETVDLDLPAAPPLDAVMVFPAALPPNQLLDLQTAKKGKIRDFSVPQDRRRNWFRTQQSKPTTRHKIGCCFQFQDVTRQCLLVAQIEAFFGLCSTNGRKSNNLHTGQCETCS